jgi:hypothetical protein
MESIPNLTITPLAEAAEILAKLPRPIAHWKGWASRIPLASVPSPAPLTPSAAAEVEEARNETAAHVEALVGSIVSVRPQTLVIDGDSYAPDSFTALIPRLLAALPLVAFKLQGKEGECLRSWGGALARARDEGGSAHASFTLVSVPRDPAAEATPEASDYPYPDYKYVYLGATALQATGSEHVFCVGGGEVVAEEQRVARRRADAGAPPVHWTVAPVRRWLTNKVEDGVVQLEWETPKL